MLWSVDDVYVCVCVDGMGGGLGVFAGNITGWLKPLFDGVIRSATLLHPEALNLNYLDCKT